MRSGIGTHNNSNNQQTKSGIGARRNATTTTTTVSKEVGIGTHNNGNKQQSIIGIGAHHYATNTTKLMEINVDMMEDCEAEGREQAHTGGCGRQKGDETQRSKQQNNNSNERSDKVDNDGFGIGTQQGFSTRATRSTSNLEGIGALRIEEKETQVQR